MKQLTFDDITDFLTVAIKAIEEDEAKNETPEPEVVQDDYAEANDAFNYATDEDDPAPMTPIDEVITRFLMRMAAYAELPTLKQAQTIAILDAINSKYNQ